MARRGALLALACGLGAQLSAAPAPEPSLAESSAAAADEERPSKTPGDIQVPRRRRASKLQLAKELQAEKPAQTGSQEAYDQEQTLTSAIMGALTDQKAQVAELDEVMAEEKAKLIADVYHRSPQMNALLMGTRAKARKVKADAIELDTDLKLTSQNFETSIMKMRDSLKKTEVGQKRFDKDIQIEAANDMKNMQNEVNVVKQQVERAKVPSVDYIKAGEEAGMKKLKDIELKVLAARANNNRNLKRLDNTNRQNLKAIKGSTKEFDRTFSETKKILEFMPEMLSEKAMKLKQELLVQQSSRDSQIEAMADDEEGLSKKFNRNMNRLADEAQTRVGQIHDAEAKMDEKTLKALSKDRRSFEKFGQGIAKDLVKEGAETVQMIQRSQRQTEQHLSIADEQLARHLEQEQRYAPDTEKVLEKLALNEQEKFVNLRNDRSKQMLDLQHGFETGMHRAVGAEAKEMDREVFEMLNNGKEAARRAGASAEAQISPLVKEVDDIAVKASTDTNNLRKSNMALKDLGVHAEGLERNIITTKDRVIKKIYAKDKAVMNGAREAIAGEQANLQRSLKYVERARQNALQNNRDMEEHLTETFAKKADYAKRVMQSKLKNEDALTKGLASAAEQSKILLEGKIGETERSIAGVEKMLKPHTARNFRSKLDDMLAATKAQVDGVEDDVNTVDVDESESQQSVTKVAEDAIAMSQGMVNKHITGFEGRADDAVRSITTATAPLMKANKLYADNAYSKNTNPSNSPIYYVYENAAQKLSDANHVTSALEETSTDQMLESAQQQKRLAAGTADTPGAVVNEVTGAGNKVAAMRGAAESAVQEWGRQQKAAKDELESEDADGSSGLIPEAVQRVKQQITTMKSSFVDADGVIDKVFTDPSRGINAKLVTLKSDLNTEIDSTVKNIQSGAAELDQSTKEVGAKAAEAEAYRMRTQAALTTDAKTLAEAVASERTAAEHAHRGFMGQLDRESALITDGAEHDLQMRAEADAREVTAAQTDAAKLTAKAGQQAQEGSAAVLEEMQNFKGSAEEQVGGLANSLAALKASVSKQSMEDDAKHQALLSATEKIKAEQEMSSKKFEAAIARTGNMLAKLAGQDSTQIQALTTQLLQIEQVAKAKVTTQDEQDTLNLNLMKGDLKTRVEGVAARVAETHEKVERFSTQLAQVDQASEATLDQTADAADHFEESLAATDRQFAKRVADENRVRRNATSWLQTLSNQNYEAMSAIMSVIEDMERKTTATVQHRLGTLDLDNAAVNKKLEATLELEKYQEHDAIDKVYAKLAQVKTLEEKLHKWRASAVEAGDSFKDTVVKSFGEMGHDLDLTEMELAEEQAAEQWAVEQASAQLRAHLGAELHDLSSTSEARLDELARKAGKQIALLMKDQSLSKEERAAALAKIKEDARKQASHILEQNGRLQLDQDTAARNLHIATDEIEATMNRIGSIEDATFVKPKGIQQIFERIHGLLNQANAKTDEGPETATSFLESGVSADAMMRVALSESDQAIADDAHMTERLSKLLPQFAL